MSKEVLFTARPATIAEILDDALPQKEIAKTRDEHGLDRWDFRVISESYGKLVVSFYPARAEETYYQHFAKQMTSSLCTDLVDAALAFDHKFPGILRTQVSHAMRILESVLPDMLEKAIVLSGQVAIHRTIFDLDGTTHHLDKGVRASDSTPQLEETAREMMRAHVHHPRGQRRQRITAQQIRAAYRRCGPKASQLTIASALGISDRQLRKKHLPGERYSDFRDRHT